MGSEQATSKYRDSELLADAVHERLRDAILMAELRPNHRLVEEDLAAWLEVSRTPIREALLRLRQEGLVIRSKGWLVRENSPADVVRLLEARCAIEGHAAALAAARITTVQLEGLRHLADQMERPGVSRQKTNMLNNQFHEQVTDAAGNFLLSQFYRRTRTNYWNFAVPVVFHPDDDALVHSDHRALIAALEARDAGLSSHIATVHVQRTAEIVTHALGMKVVDHAE